MRDPKLCHIRESVRVPRALRGSRISGDFQFLCVSRVSCAADFCRFRWIFWRFRRVVDSCVSSFVSLQGGPPLKQMVSSSSCHGALAPPSAGTDRGAPPGTRVPRRAPATPRARVGHVSRLRDRTGGPRAPLRGRQLLRGVPRGGRRADARLGGRVSARSSGDQQSLH